jgi:DNA polymerase
MRMSERQKRYLRAMGIDAWEARDGLYAMDAERGGSEAAEQQQQPPEDLTQEALHGIEDIPDETTQQPPVCPVEQMDWDTLKKTALGCQACDLHKTRTQAVFGVGNTNAQWMIIGEAPGADEDRQGEPFVGRAGQLLNNMLAAMGLRREEVYIANILKCRPPNNRDPKPEEVAKCESYLQRQVQLIAPKVILALGRVSAHNLLKTDVSLGRLRGKTFFYGDFDTPVVVTYHPAYLLRSPQEKRKAWHDLQYAMQVSNTLN